MFFHGDATKSGRLTRLKGVEPHSNVLTILQNPFLSAGEDCKHTLVSEICYYLSTTCTVCFLSKHYLDMCCARSCEEYLVYVLSIKELFALYYEYGGVKAMMERCQNQNSLPLNIFYDLCVLSSHR